MAAATYAPIALGQVAGWILEDLAISRTQLGIAIALASLSGAAASPPAGRVIQRIGGRNGMMGLFFVAGLGFGGMGAAMHYWLLLLAIAAVGAAGAAGNPATNLLIARAVPPGARGVITGLKQSGVQVGVFLGGITVPLGAERIGWRWSFALVGAVFLIAAVVTKALAPDGEAEIAPTPRERGGIRLPFVRWLTAYGFLLGFGGSMAYLVPLFAEEALGMSRRAGGLASALFGLTAVGTRIWWGRYAERSGRFLRALALIAGGSLVSIGVFLASQAGLPWLLWVGAIGLGASSLSWNSVGMLAIIARGPDRAATASGLVVGGFLAGLGLGPILLAALVDATGTYTWSWLVAAGAHVAALGSMVAPGAGLIDA